MFAADLVAKKIIVFYGGITNDEAGKQAPYRYLGGFDNNATVINAVQFAARQLKGRTAKWSGDFTTKKRVFGVIRPESGIDWQYFASTAKQEGLTLRLAAELVYSVPLDTSQITAKNQEEAPVLVAKLKDAGVTTVLLFSVVRHEPAAAQGCRQPRLPPRVALHGDWAPKTSRSRHGSSRASRPSR